MPVDPADVERVKATMATLPDGEADGWSELHSVAEVLAATIAVARAEGRDELQAIELVAKAADLSRADRRHAQGVLRRLGYRLAANVIRSYKKAG